MTRPSSLGHLRKSYSLQELVDASWYITDSGPVYWEGGPLVIYLMERYGPEKFFELYSGVRRPTFHDDCQVIMGDSWQTIEEEFWPWLEREAKQIAESTEEDAGELEMNTTAEIRLADTVNPSDWREFLESYRSTRNGENETLPTNTAFAVSLERVDTSEEHGLLDELSTFEFRAIFEDDSFWIVEDFCRHT